MKALKFFRLLSLLAGLFSFSFAVASFGGGSIMGQVTDPETQEPVEFATVVLTCQGVQKVYKTDEKGFYYASNIPAGTYTIIASYLSKKIELPPVTIASDETREVNIALGTGVFIGDITVTAKTGEKVLLDKFDPTRFTYDKKDLENKPILKMQDIPSIMNIPEVDGNYYVRGSREGGLAWYIDGCKITGDPNIPVCGVQTFRTYANFIPAKYGDTLGGVVAIETRNWFTE